MENEPGDNPPGAPEEKPRWPLEIEARLLAQEHRWFHIVRNFWSRKRFRDNDPRKDAVISAFIWKVLSPSSVAITGAGLLSLATLGTLFYQNRLIYRQIESQQAQFAAGRRTQLIAWLYEADENGKPKADSRTREEAMVEFIALERSEIKRTGARRGVSLHEPTWRT